MELIMIQQQRHGGSLFHQGGRVLGESGVTGLFRGLVTSCGREGLFTAGYLGLGPVLSERLRAAYDLQKKVGDMAGATCAGVIAATLSHPLDTIKTCMQALAHASPLVLAAERTPHPARLRRHRGTSGGSSTARRRTRRARCSARVSAASSTGGAGARATRSSPSTS
jgi:hypothetical protein